MLLYKGGPPRQEQRQELSSKTTKKQPDNVTTNGLVPIARRLGTISCHSVRFVPLVKDAAKNCIKDDISCRIFQISPPEDVIPYGCPLVSFRKSLCRESWVSKAFSIRSSIASTIL